MTILKPNFKTIAAILLVVSMVLTIAGCGAKPSEESSSDASSSSSSSSESVSEVQLPPDAPKESKRDKIVEMFNKNSDTVGWLFLPNTHIDEAIVQNPPNDTKNQYYLRKNLEKKYDFNGCYFADFECNFEDGLSRNTVIYGHNMDDNPEGIKFAQLRKWLDLDFAKKNPYIYFSTPEKDMVWKIFSVMYTSVKFNYVQTDPDNTEFLNIINEARKASQYNYEVDVNVTDKIITLSTCTYVYGGSNTSQRYVIMARLVRPGEEMPAEISLEKNPSPKAPTF